jgi:hypothetical protein
MNPVNTPGKSPSSSASRLRTAKPGVSSGFIISERRGRAEHTHSGKGGSGYRPGGFGLFSPFSTALFGASELRIPDRPVLEATHSVSIQLDGRVLKQPSAAVGFPQRAMEKGVGLAISPLADTPNRLFFPESGKDP